MKTAILLISEAGYRVAKTIREEFGYELFTLHHEPDATHVDSIDGLLSRLWEDREAFIFIGAMGICVRSIAPYIADKHRDPAVVCVDCTGKHAISVVSGHVGGANQLTAEVASVLGARPVITTLSDNSNLWALDRLAKDNGWEERTEDKMNDMIFAFVNRQPTALLLDIRDRGTEKLEESLPDHVTLVEKVEDITPERFKLAIIVSPRAYKKQSGLLQLQYVPRVFDIGVGLARQAQPVDEIIRNIIHTLEYEHGLLFAPRQICTIDVKADEPVIKEWQRKGIDVRFFTAEELSQVEAPTPSEVVEKHVGTPGVSEPAAILGAENGVLILPKQKGKDFTVAVAIDRKYLRQGHIEIVGAGPGDPDLVSVRGRKMLEKADLILYAGSLVPRALTECAKEGAVVRSSAAMAIEEQCTLMKEFYDKGKFIVRLHTGDPCIFGAIQEQMAFFDEHNMSYHITPGISSFLAAAAELRSQFTIPERVQTIILTRGEGRTPMPDKEKLHLLARSQSTMCIFLSAAIVDDVQRQLLEEYPEDTPVAACYHLTWPDQRIFRGKLKDLSRIVKDNGLTLTTMIVVGEAIDNRQGNSALYDRHFTHLFRKGVDD
ncbi:MAG: precorrin-4 C(11)-methyltransferase [Prevotella sp.]|nr:precorrin-4 C(11)-methyltransferase [Prevotella sp.]